METFVVRVWTPADSETGQVPDVLRGTVEHVRSGGGATFSSREELLASLASLLEAPSCPGGPAESIGKAKGAATALESEPRRRP